MCCNCHEEHCCEHNHEGACCSHKHKEESQRLLILRLVFGIAIFIIAAIFRITPLYIAAYIIAGYDVIIAAVKNMRNVLGESFLMTLASLGAFALGEAPEGAAVMLFYQLGEFLSHHAAGKTKKSIAELMDLRADTAAVLKDGKFVTVPCKNVIPGDIIRVTAGEKIPLDGAVTKGTAYLDTAALTGEAVPVLATPESQVISGSICLDSVIEIKVTKEFSESTVSKILELVSSKNSGKSERFISKFAKIYTPLVVISALLVAIIPSVFTGDVQKWVYTALSLLMISCPCALVVSVPLSFVAGIGGASKKGILLKGSYAIEALSGIKQLAFDKTGTLTEGSFKIREIIAEGISEEELLTYAAYAEYYSKHPIARAISKEYGKKITADEISDYRETAGKGVSCTVFGKKIIVGKSDFAGGTGTVKNAVYVSIDGKFSGYIVVEDSLKSGAKTAISQLKAINIESIMLTGDSEENARGVAEELGIPYYAGLLPQDKIDRLKESGKRAAFVGDGINDAPVISCADVGISMGGIGSDAAIEASDCVIMSDAPEKVPEAIKSAGKTMKIVWENIILAIGIKVIVMCLGLSGHASMWAAVFVDVGVCLIAVLNAIRAYKD